MPRPSLHPLSPLGVVLSRLLEARRITDSDFARKSGLSKGLISQIKHRAPTKLPKHINVERWIKLLGLSQADAVALREAAELSWSPKGIQELVARLSKRQH